MSYKLPESKPKSLNTNIVDDTYVEAVMPETDFNKIEIEKSDFKISLLFPSKTEADAEIKKDIKAILSCALREQMEHKTH